MLRPTNTEILSLSYHLTSERRASDVWYCHRWYFYHAFTPEIMHCNQEVIRKGALFISELMLSKVGGPTDLRIYYVAYGANSPYVGQSAGFELQLIIL